MNSETTYVKQVPVIPTLVPVRVANKRPLEGEWTGNELTGVRVTNWLTGPKHVLQLGYENAPHHANNFRIEFVVHMPVVAHVDDLRNPEIKAEAERMAWVFLHMLNLRRRVLPSMADYNEKDVRIAEELWSRQRKELT